MRFNFSCLLKKFPSYQEFTKRSIVIVKATKSDKKNVAKFMEEIFYKQDPSSILTGVAEKARLSYTLIERTVDSLDENLSFLAKADDTDPRILGVVINGVRPTNINDDYMKSSINEVVCDKEKKLLTLWKHIAQKPKNPKTYFGETKEVFEIRFLAVHPSAQRRGIAKALADKSRQEAEEQGFKFIRIECTSAHSARLAKNAGMKCIYKLDYADYKDDDGKRVFEGPIHPHTCVRVYIEEINKD